MIKKFKKLTYLFLAIVTSFVLSSSVFAFSKGEGAVHNHREGLTFPASYNGKDYNYGVKYHSLTLSQNRLFDAYCLDPHKYSGSNGSNLEVSAILNPNDKKDAVLLYIINHETATYSQKVMAIRAFLPFTSYFGTSPAVNWDTTQTDTYGGYANFNSGFVWALEDPTSAKKVLGLSGDLSAQRLYQISGLSSNPRGYGHFESGNILKTSNGDVAAAKALYIEALKYGARTNEVTHDTKMVLIGQYGEDKPSYKLIDAKTNTYEATNKIRFAVTFKNFNNAKDVHVPIVVLSDDFEIVKMEYYDWTTKQAGEFDNNTNFKTLLNNKENVIGVTVYVRTTIKANNKDKFGKINVHVHYLSEDILDGALVKPKDSDYQRFFIGERKNGEERAQIGEYRTGFKVTKTKENNSCKLVKDKKGNETYYDRNGKKTNKDTYLSSCWICSTPNGSDYTNNYSVTDVFGSDAYVIKEGNSFDFDKSGKVYVMYGDEGYAEYLKVCSKKTENEPPKCKIATEYTVDKKTKVRKVETVYYDAKGRKTNEAKMRNSCLTCQKPGTSNTVTDAANNSYSVNIQDLYPNKDGRYAWAIDKNYKKRGQEGYKPDVYVKYGKQDENADYYKYCGEAPTCKIVDGTYFGAQGQATNEDTYYKECYSCVPKDKADDGKYHNYQGKPTDEQGYLNSCFKCLAPGKTDRVGNVVNQYYVKKDNIDKYDTEDDVWVGTYEEYDMYCHSPEDYCASINPDDDSFKKDTSKMKHYINTCCKKPDEKGFSVIKKCEEAKTNNDQAGIDKWCKLKESYCDYCNTTIEIPQTCSEFEPGEFKKEKDATITGPTDIKVCIFEGTDESNESYKLDRNLGQDSLVKDNKYCKVYCKEDYKLSIPGGRYAISGSYFTLQSTAEGTKTCYTDMVDYDQFNADLETYKSQLTQYAKGSKEYNNTLETIEDSINQINGCAAGWSDDYNFDPKIKFSYNEDYIKMFSSEELKKNLEFTQVNTTSAKVDNWFCQGTAADVNNSYTECQNGSSASSINKKAETIGDKTYEIVNNFKYAKKSVNIKADLVPKAVFYTKFSTGVIDINKEGNNIYTVLEDELASKVSDQETLKTARAGGIPVSLKDGRGVYNYKLTLSGIGEYYNKVKDNKAETGRIIGGKNAVIDNSTVSKFQGTYVCSYVVNCPDCPPACQDDPEHGLFCELPDPCDGKDKCDIECAKDGTCAYDNEFGALYTYHQSSLETIGTRENGEVGANWKADESTPTGMKAAATIEAIQKAGETIYEKPQYSFTFTPAAISYIRNDNHENGYVNDNVTCKMHSAIVAEEKGNNSAEYKEALKSDYQICTSDFLDELQGVKGVTVNAELSTARKITTWLESPFCTEGSHVCALVGADGVTKVGKAWK